MYQLSTSTFVRVIDLKSDDADYLTSEEFDELWNLKPVNKLVLNFGGKDQVCPRYSRNYIRRYKFNSNNVEFSNEVPPIVQRVLDKANTRVSSYTFNQCLVNWYEDDGYIGYHSDDTRPLVYRSPIASYSYMKSNVVKEFALKSKATKTVDLLLPIKNNRLIIMEGSCQETHMHSALRSVTEEDGRRINITFRCFI